jgi:hypothetical protein
MGIDLKTKYTEDLLERNKEIEILSPIIENVNSSLVLAVNAPWGTGKTTFVELWRDYLENKGLKVIFFNAWETDFAEDPLIALISTLDKWVQSLDDGYFKHKVWSDFKQKLVPKILKRSAIAGAKLATAGILDIEKDYEKILSDLSGEITGDLIDKFNEKSQAITQFKDVIKKVLDKLPEYQQNLIIFIDELDRCRPTYAIELLERIKHLFDIERLVFILSTDTEQLAHSICAVYGNDFDAKKYLDRFIDLDYSLKEPNLKKYIESQFESLSITKFYENQRDGTYYQEFVVMLIFFLAKRLRLKLRDINLLITRLVLVWSIPDRKSISETILIILIILREYNYKLYKNYQLNPKDITPVIEFLADGISEIEFTSEKEHAQETYMDVFIQVASVLIAYSEEHSEEKINGLCDYCMTLILSSYQNLEDKDNRLRYHKTNLENTILAERKKLNWNYPSRFNFMSTITEYIELLHRAKIN